MKTITLSAGGTAGHVFPACALSLELKKAGYRTILITDIRGKNFIKDEFDEVIILPIYGLNFKFYFLSPLLFLKSIYYIFKTEQLITFGGYTTLFPILASILLRKKYSIIQLDSHVTRLNRYFLKFANKIFYAFAQTNFGLIKEFDKKKYELTGIPMRDGYEFSILNHSKTDFVISIMGGSLGSNYWIDLIKDFASLLKEEVRKNIILNIQTKENIEFLLPFNFKQINVQSFFDTSILFKNSHLIITRCGANTLAEISAIARPSALVPWKNAIEDHQTKNAKNFEKFNSAKCIESANDLFIWFNELYENEKQYLKACENAAKSFPQYAKHKIIISIN